MQQQHPFQVRLLDTGEQAALQVLAQDHAEEGRRRRVGKRCRGQVDPRLVGQAAEEELSGFAALAQVQDKGFFFRLKDAIDPAAHQGKQFFSDGRQEKAVKSHTDIPPKIAFYHH
jgi:hypothetical protein